MYNQKNNLLLCLMLVGVCPYPVVNLNNGLTGVQLCNVREALVVEDPYANQH